MTNEQLSLLLQQYATLLDMTINELERKLPEELKEEYQSLLGHKGKKYKILDGVKGVKNRIEDDAERLNGEL